MDRRAAAEYTNVLDAGVLPVDEKPDHFYLRYVTLGQIVAELKVVAVWWLYLSAATTVVTLILHAAKSGEVSKLLPDVLLAQMRRDVGGLVSWLGFPRAFWYWLAILVSSWFLNEFFGGETITIPDLSFVAWVLLNVSIGGVIVADALLPPWALGPVFCALIQLPTFYERLVEVGRINQETIGLTTETIVGP